MHSAIKETTVKQRDSRTDCNINRYMIMERVYGCANWLATKALQKRCVGNDKINAMRGAIHGYHVVLQALRDYQLDELMREIEAIKKHIGMT